ncbi:hypothetical protein [Embleya sp. NPDC005971]|uniref:hypothetical protein n=1 Tax=Embleya sp. NPDC005971 TaxID=3156724 RepID=UPI0033FCEBAE
MHHPLTPLERDVHDLIAEALITDTDTSLADLARHIVATVQGPSPITPKTHALPEDARHIARHLEATHKEH